MANIRDDVFTLLSAKGMSYKDISFSDVVDNLLSEMDRGLAGEESSLAMIPTYVEAGKEIPVGEKTLVLDAGGTNLRVSSVSFDAEGKPEIGYFKKYSMPGKDKEVSKEEFYTLLAEYLDPVAGEADRLGFCFSYPMSKTPDKDGIPHKFSKQIKAPEVVGVPVGASLAEKLAEKGKSLGHKPVLLNDTIATLLTGMSANIHKKYSTFIGFILGTGLNTGYVEQNSKIGKVKGLEDGGSMIINMESGGFSHPPRGDWDRAFDTSTIDEGHYVYEKMMSGAYFGPLCTVSLQSAASDGFFSDGFNKALLSVEGQFGTPVADGYLHNPQNEKNELYKLLKAGDEADALKVFYILEALMERAAMMAAANLAAAVIKTGHGSDPLAPVCITADGTTFYKNKDFPFRVHRHMRPYLIEEKGLFYEITQVDDAPLVGAAIAGLTN